MLFHSFISLEGEKNKFRLIFEKKILCKIQFLNNKKITFKFNQNQFDYYHLELLRF